MKQAYRRLSREAQLVVEALDLVDLLEQARRDAQMMIDMFGYDDFAPRCARLTRLIEKANCRADRRIAAAERSCSSN